MTFGQSPAVFTSDKRDMPPAWRRKVERCGNGLLARCAREQIIATHDIAYPLPGVIYNNSELIGGAVRSPNWKVADCGAKIETVGAGDLIIDRVFSVINEKPPCLILIWFIPLTSGILRSEHRFVSHPIMVVVGG
tara:strand:- start:39 stop:443 length:405 start_codon:yes stop_codon:yes gene_type:complete